MTISSQIQYLTFSGSTGSTGSCHKIFIYNLIVLIDVARKEQRTVTISGKILEKLRQKYDTEKAKKPTLSFGGFIAEQALIELERKDLLNEARFISLIGIQDDTLFLKDARVAERFIEIKLFDKKIKCLTDSSFNCIHVGFALALPEVRKVLNQ